MVKSLSIAVVCACMVSCAATTSEQEVTHSDFVPEGYELVWNDEFDSDAVFPDTARWTYETGGGGWGNNELQYYLPACSASDTVAFLRDGSLVIRAVKLGNPIDGCRYASARMNTTKAWKYGYFEGRMKLPVGTGTWPAFWMLPQKFSQWPLEGEMDIMEHVGSNPDTVHITMHTQKYNHTIGTQQTSINYVRGVQSEFHVYALQWTPDSICGFIDGKQCFSFVNDGKGDKETWPFDVPFLLKLNLAIGGNMGGNKGVDDSCFPAEFVIDYIRVNQQTE